MHPRNVQRPRGFCTCWRMLVLWILRWHCFSFVSVAVSVRWYILFVLHLPLLWQMFDNDIHHAFAECTAVDTFGNSWQQAQLSLCRGGLGLRNLSHHSAAAYISSVSASEQCSVSMSHLFTSVNLFNALISPADAIILDDIVSSPCRQRTLSSKIENHQFQLLFNHSSLPDRACLLSVSSPHAAAWLSVIPSPGLNLHMDPPGIPNCLEMVARCGFGSGPQLHLLSKSCLGSLGPPCHYMQAWW